MGAISRYSFLDAIDSLFKGASSFYEINGYQKNQESCLFLIDNEKPASPQNDNAVVYATPKEELDSKRRLYLCDAPSSLHLPLAEEFLKQHQVPYYKETKNGRLKLVFDYEQAKALSHAGNFMFASIMPLMDDAYHNEKNTKENDKFCRQLVEKYNPLFPSSGLNILKLHMQVVAEGNDTKIFQPKMFIYFSTPNFNLKQIVKDSEYPGFEFEISGQGNVFNGRIAMDPASLRHLEPMLQKLNTCVDAVAKCAKKVTELKHFLLITYLPTLAKFQKGSQAEELLKLETYSNWLNEDLSFKEIEFILEKVKLLVASLKAKISSVSHRGLFSESKEDSSEAIKDLSEEIHDALNEAKNVKLEPEAPRRIFHYSPVPRRA
ncbi:MAG: hypothetical protein P4M14_13575 [Gammaproteobacteria bacterium]|nr:hypothetical protein [Gammaproteobacteria bacterium]